LAFDAEDELLLLDIDNKVFPFQISRYFDSNVKVADCLGPFVRQSSLLFCFLGACCCLFGGGEFWVRCQSMISKGNKSNRIHSKMKHNP
jgi:hypothetical protein